MATAGTVLQLNGNKLDNTSGSIAADGATVDVQNASIYNGAVTLAGRSTLTLLNATISGSTVNNSTSGTIEVSGFGEESTLSGVVNNPKGGQIAIDRGVTLQLIPFKDSNLDGIIGLSSSGIMGTATGADFGLLDVTGSASLAGTLDIGLTDGSLLMVGKSFDIVTAKTVSCSSWAGLEFAIDSLEHFVTDCNRNDVALAVVAGADGPTVPTGWSPGSQPDTVSTPEPGSLDLLGTALLGFAWVLSRRHHVDDMS